MSALWLPDFDVRSAETSRRKTFHHAREGNGLSHVVKATDPCDTALETHAKACVGNGSVFAKIEEPAEGLSRELMLVDSTQ